MLALSRSRLAHAGPSFRRLLLSEALTLLAAMVGYLAMPWWIAQAGGGRDLAIYGFVLALVRLAATPLLAPLAERCDPRRLLVAGLAVQGAATLVLAALAGGGRYALAPLLLVSLLQVLADAVVQPVAATRVADLVPAERLPDALALQKSAQACGRVAGPALAGLLLAGPGIAATLACGAVLLALAAVAAAGIPPADASAALRRGWWQDLRGGLRAKWAIPLERGWTLVNFLAWIFLFPALTLLVPLKVAALGLSGAWLGACEVALSLGVLLGALGGAGWLIARVGRFRCRLGAAIAEGLTLAVAGLTGSPLLLVAAFLCMGYANSVLSLVGQTHRLLGIPREYRVRFAAANLASSQIASALGPALAGLALLHWPVQAVYAGFGLAAAGCASAFALVPRAREFLELDHAVATDWYRRQYPAAFDAAAAEP